MLKLNSKYQIHRLCLFSINSLIHMKQFKTGSKCIQNLVYYTNIMDNIKQYQQNGTNMIMIKITK